MTRSTAAPHPPRPGTDLTKATTGELVQHLSAQLTELVRAELALVRLELAAKGRRAGAGVGIAGVGGVLALYAGGALVVAAIAALALVLDVWAAALLVAAVLLVVAGVLGTLGRNWIRQATPMIPEQAAWSVRQDVAAVKAGLHR